MIKVSTSKTVTFKRDTEAMGLGVYVAMLERQDICFFIVETEELWTVTITGHRI